MTLPPKLEKLFDNWQAKIISLGAAILLYVFYLISSLETRYFVIPLEIKQEAGMVCTEQSESSIKVSIRGNVTEINTLEPKDFIAYADVGRYVTEGSVVVPVQLTLSDNVRIMKDVEIKIQPETVAVSLEKKLSTYVPVKVNYNGGTAHGYELESVTSAPSMIKIRGPRSIVEDITELETDVILFDNLHMNSTMESELLEINSQIICEHEGPVSIEVKVVPSKMQRTLTNLPVTLTNIPETLECEIPKGNATCSISGNELDVEKFVPSSGFVFADCSEIIEPGEYDIPLQYRKTYNLNIDSLNPETIHVVFTEKPVEEPVEEEE